MPKSNSPAHVAVVPEELRPLAAVEPVPPGREAMLAGHHWLEQRTADGESLGPIILQWQPFRKEWCHSGWIGTYNNRVETKYYKYIAACPLPVEW